MPLFYYIISVCFFVLVSLLFLSHRNLPYICALTKLPKLSEKDLDRPDRKDGYYRNEPQCFIFVSISR